MVIDDTLFDPKSGVSRSTWFPGIAIYRHRRASEAIAPEQTFPSGGDALNVSGYAVSVDWSKRHEAVGEITVTLTESLTEEFADLAFAPEKGSGPIDWSREIESGDWWALQFRRGDGSYAVAIGVVDMITETTEPPATDRTFVLVGRDHGGALEDNEVFTFPTMPADSRGLVLTIAMVSNAMNEATRWGRIGAGPSEIIPEILKFTLNPGGTDAPSPALLPPALSAILRRAADDVVFRNRYLHEALGVLVEAGLPGALAEYDLAGSGDGLVNSITTMDLLRRYANDGWNEVVVDLFPNGSLGNLHEDAGALRPLGSTYLIDADGWGFVPGIVVRERPFPARREGEGALDRWNALPITEIDLRMTEVTNLTRGNAERFNFFLARTGANYEGDPYTPIFASLDSGGLGMTSVPAVNIESVAKHGWRRCERDSPYLTTRAEDLVAGANAHVALTHRLRDFYALNHHYLSGQVVVPTLLPGVRCGERLRVVYPGGRKVTGYVEGVDLTWDRDEDGVISASSVLSITRGHEGDRPPLPNLALSLAGVAAR